MLTLLLSTRQYPKVLTCLAVSIVLANPEAPFACTYLFLSSLFAYYNVGAKVAIL